MLEKRFKIVLYSYSVLFTKKKLELGKNVQLKKKKRTSQLLNKFKEIQD